MTITLFIYMFIASFIGCGLALCLDRTYNEIIYRRIVKREREAESEENE